MEHREVEIRCFGNGALSGKSVNFPFLMLLEGTCMGFQKQASVWSPVAVLV